MNEQLSNDRYAIHHGDCLDVLKSMESESDDVTRARCEVALQEYRSAHACA